VLPAAPKGTLELPTSRLTQAAVDRLKPPASGRVEYWDTHQPGFGLRVSETGRKTWMAMYRVDGKLVRETIGTHANIPQVDVARDLARQSIALARRGINPAGDRERARADTVGLIVDRYLRHIATRMRPRTVKEVSRTLIRDIKGPLGARPIRDLARRDLRELIEAIVARGSPSHANHTLAYARTMLGWAVSNDILETNPADGIKMPSLAPARERALDDHEIARFWSACDEIGWPFGPAFKLMLLTGQRRTEVAEARWSEIDVSRALWTLPSERTKNGKGHLVHLAPFAIDIITALPRIAESPFLFPGRRKDQATGTGEQPVRGFSYALANIAAIMEAVAPIEHFTIHDLRRSFATGCARIGVAHHVLDRVLNHTAGAITGTARIYNRHQYLPEREGALDAWAAHVQSLVETLPSNVEPIEKGRRRRSA
jgi:integrase